MSLRTWSHRACIGTLVILLAGCGAGSTTAGNGSGDSGGTGATGSSGNNTGGSAPVVTGVSTPKSVSVVTAN